MFVFRYIIIVNLVVVKRLGLAGMIFSISLGEKCEFVLLINFWLVIELGFQLFMKWNLLFVWRGR